MNWNSKKIVTILQKSAIIAVNVQQKAEVSTKTDGTIVTEADTRIEALITEMLHAIDPKAYIIGEETFQSQDTSYFTEALNTNCYVIDPIDGTTLYAHGLPGWGISIGLLKRGKFAEGAIMYPTSGELLISQGNTVLYARDTGYYYPSYELLRPLEPPQIDPRVITVNQSVVKQGKYRGNLTVLSTGSCVSSILYLAQGSSLGYISQSKLWDLAGGIPLLQKLGFNAYSLQGSQLPTTVHKDFWHIPPSTPETMWMLRQPILLCKNEQSFETITKDMVKE